MSDWEDIAIIIGFLALVALSIWMTAAGPCWLFALTPSAELPARCLAEFIR